MRALHPAGWAPSKGFSNGIAAEGRQVFVAGQIGWNAQQEIVSDDFVAQVDQALRNIVEILAEAGARPEHLVRLTWYVTDKREYLARAREVGQAYQHVIGRHLPGDDARPGGGAIGGTGQGRDRVNRGCAGRTRLSHCFDLDLIRLVSLRR